MKFNPEKYGKLQSSTKRKRIEKSLFNQLRSKYLIDDHWVDVVYDYLRLWDLKEELFKSIERDGASVQGLHGPKSNPCIRDLHNTEQQMSKLLDSIGLKAEPLEEDDEDDDF